MGWPKFNIGISAPLGLAGGNELAPFHSITSSAMVTPPQFLVPSEK
jgi:hypothetical protein